MIGIQNALHIVEPPSIDSELPHNDETLGLRAPATNQ